MRIVMVCTGNICRSPMAEAFMRQRLREAGCGDEVLSAGVFAYEGDAASQDAVEAMKEYDLDLAEHRSRALKEALTRDALILCMTGSHKRSILHVYPEARVYTLGEYAGLGEDIADPYGRGIAVYRRCAAQIDRAVDAAAARWLRER